MDFEFGDILESAKLIKKISNGEESVYIYQKENGEVYSEDGCFFANINDDSFDDALEEFECGWREVHWNRSDWADWYGCDENEVDDCTDDDIKDYY